MTDFYKRRKISNLSQKEKNIPGSIDLRNVLENQDFYLELAKNEYDAFNNRLTSTSLWELIEIDVIYCIYKTLGNFEDLPLHNINKKITSIDWDEKKWDVFLQLQQQDFYGFNPASNSIDDIKTHIDWVFEVALKILQDRQEYGPRVDDILNRLKKFYDI